MAPDTPMIVVDEVVKEFGLFPALRGVTLEVPAGGSLALVGPNGAGKTTLVRIIASLLRATRGTVRVGGWRLPAQASRVRRYLGVVSHQSQLYADLTAAENLDFFARLYDLPDRELRIRRALQQVGLAARERDPVRTFSRGMVQRLVIARATLHSPQVLLLDEPYTGLDPAGVALLDDLLRRERADGRTILLVTHNLAQAATLAERVAILHRGKIAGTVAGAQLTPGSLAAHYHAVTAGERMVPA